MQEAPERFHFVSTSYFLFTNHSLLRDPDARAIKNRINRTEEKLVMCPIKPDALIPTMPGVYWRDTDQWVKYSPEISALIVDGYHSYYYAIKGCKPSAKRTIDFGCISSTHDPHAVRATKHPKRFINLGSISSPAHPGGENYRVDLLSGVQLSSKGFMREVLVVPNTAQKVVMNSDNILTRQEQQLLLLLAHIRAMYTRHVDSFVSSGKNMVKNSSTPLNLLLNPVLWDFRQGKKGTNLHSLIDDTILLVNRIAFAHEIVQILMCYRCVILRLSVLYFSIYTREEVPRCAHPRRSHGGQPKSDAGIPRHPLTQRSDHNEERLLSKVSPLIRRRRILQRRAVILIDLRA